MAKVLTYGVVGGGAGAPIGDAHRRPIALDSPAKLVAGPFSRGPGKAAQMAEGPELDTGRCYAGYQEMAQEEAARPDGIGFVVVATPNFSHYGICKAFLDAGIHVA